MSGNEKVVLLFEVQAVKDVAGPYLWLVVLQDLENGVAGEEDAFLVDALVQEVLAAVRDVGEEPTGGVVDDLAVPLFGDPRVEASVACLHVEDWHICPFGD